MLTFTSGRGKPLAVAEREEHLLELGERPGAAGLVNGEHRGQESGALAAVPRRWRSANRAGGTRPRRWPVRACGASARHRRGRRWSCAGVVTTMPKRRTRSPSRGERWTTIAAAHRSLPRAVTWIARPRSSSMPHRTAALKWLSAAPSPQASTAAMKRPLRVSAVCPTAYTLRCTRWNHPFLTRPSIRVLAQAERDRAERARPRRAAASQAPRSPDRGGPSSDCCAHTRHK